MHADLQSATACLRQVSVSTITLSRALYAHSEPENGTIYTCISSVLSTDLTLKLRKCILILGSRDKAYLFGCLVQLTGKWQLHSVFSFHDELGF